MNINILDSLTPQQLLEVEAKIVGYEKLPPTIEEFINSPYYLGEVYGNGKLYAYWMPILKEIFPNPVTIKYSTIVLTGCLGSGKSTISRLIGLYLECKLDHLKNFDFFELSKGKNLVFSWFHSTMDNVENTFLDPIKEIKADSPYFTTGMLNSYTLENHGDTPRGKGPIGLDVLYYVFSEVNFVKPEVAKLKLDTAYNRLSSRFEKALGYFPLIIIDSSAAESGSFVDEFVESKCDPRTTKIVRPKIWEVKPHVYRHHGWFKVYLGDSTKDAQIMHGSEEKGWKPPSDYDWDPDRFLDVPLNLLHKFSMNLNLSLNDFAGISTAEQSFFMQNRKKINEAFCLPIYNNDIIEVDFFSKDRLYDKLYKSIETIPEDRVVSIGFDIGYKVDYTGVTIAYFDGWEVTDKKNKTRRPKYKVGLSVAVGRLQGQETSIRMLYELVKDVSKKYEVGSVTIDTFQSKQLVQDLKRDGFNAYELSVDRDNNAYQTLKLAIYEGRLKIPENKLLQRELRELQLVRSGARHRLKVDHPESTSADNYTYGKGSKDISDSLSSAIAAMEKELERFTVISKPFNDARFNDHMKLRGIGNKESIIKEMKKISRGGGLERFYKRESERDELIKRMNVNFEIPSVRNKNSSWNKTLRNLENEK